MLAAGTALPTPDVRYTAIPTAGTSAVDNAMTALAIAAAFQKAARYIV
jgi:hypothetical protein